MEDLLCISPIDGRYHKITEGLNEYFSEYALIKYRVVVEIKWLLKLNEVININFSLEQINTLNSIIANFSKIITKTKMAHWSSCSFISYCIIFESIGLSSWPKIDC